MPNVPVPSRYTAGDTDLLTKFNELQAALDFLMDPPEVYLWQNNMAQSIPFNVQWTALQWNAESKDNTGMFDSSSSDTRIFAQYPGWYEIEISVAWGADSLNVVRQHTIRQGVYNPADSSYTTVLGNRHDTKMADSQPAKPIYCDEMYLNTNDYIEVLVFQWNTSSAARTLTQSTLRQEVSTVHMTWTGV